METTDFKQSSDLAFEIGNFTIKVPVEGGDPTTATGSYVGVWVPRRRGREDKVAAIGVRVRRWVSYHGVALNVDPDLAQFAGIVPCGVREHGVTSLVGLGRPVTMADVDHALRQAFDEVFGALPGRERCRGAA